LYEVVQSVQSDRRACNRDQYSSRSADYCTDNNCSATDDHQRHVLSGAHVSVGGASVQRSSLGRGANSSGVGGDRRPDASRSM
jgi:hypothetical protein